MLPPLKTGRDWAAFYLNLSRTGGDVVAYRLAGRPAFLVNSPAHAARVLEERESNYRSPAHPYKGLAGLYTSEGASLMRLERAGARRCPASNVAVKHLHVMLASLLRRCHIEPAADEPVCTLGLISLRPDPGVWFCFKRR